MTQPRRLPWDGTDHTAFCQPGGFIARLADGMEEEILRTAKGDVERVESLLKDAGFTKAELVRALAYLSQSAKAVISVAECRGERLESHELIEN